MQNICCDIQASIFLSLVVRIHVNFVTCMYLRKYWDEDSFFTSNIHLYLRGPEGKCLRTLVDALPEVSKAHQIGDFLIFISNGYFKVSLEDCKRCFCF